MTITVIVTDRGRLTYDHDTGILEGERGRLPMDLKNFWRFLSANRRHARLRAERFDTYQMETKDYER